MKELYIISLTKGYAIRCAKKYILFNDRADNVYDTYKEALAKKEEFDEEQFTSSLIFPDKITFHLWKIEYKLSKYILDMNVEEMKEDKKMSQKNRFDYAIAILDEIKEDIIEYTTAGKSIRDKLEDINYQYVPEIEDKLDCIKNLLELDIDVEQVVLDHGWPKYDLDKLSKLHIAERAIEYYQRDCIKEMESIPDIVEMSDEQFKEVFGTSADSQNINDLELKPQEVKLKSFKKG